MGAGLDMDDESTAAGVDITLGQDIGSQHHQVRFEWFLGVFTRRGNDVGAKGQVGNKLPVHHIPLEQIHARGVEGFDFGAEFREVARQDGGGDQDRQGHVLTLVGSSLNGMTKRPNRKSSARPSTPIFVQVRIDKVVAEGDGFGYLEDGRVIFVEGGLPGELVTAQIIKQSKDYARAVATAVVEANVDRVEPPCEYVVRGCGGCDLQHASIKLQRSIKVDIVTESLVRLGKIENPTVRWYDNRDLPVVGSRTTLRVAKSTTGVGFRKRRSHDVVRVTNCLVAHPKLNELLNDLRLDGAEECVVRVGAASSERLVWAEPQGSIAGVPVDVATRVDAMVHESVAGRAFQISAASFFQASPEAAEALVDATRRALGDSSTWGDGPVVDAYCGVGLFATTVFPADRHVVAIESNPTACIDARVNVADRDVEIVQIPVEEWSPIKAAVVVADPARDGLRAGGVQVLAATQAKVIVLISCDPASLGRDARLLHDNGYQLEYCEVLDLFPHTHHVEVVSRFVRSEIA